LWRRGRQFIRTAGYHLLATVLTLLFVVPLFWVLANSLRTVGLPPPAQVEWLPQPLAWGNYSRIFQIVPLAGYLRSSIWVGLLGVTITLLTASLAGFAMAQLPTRARQLLVLTAVLVMMAPNTGMWLARFVIFKQLGLIDSYGALVAPALMGTNASFVLLFYWTFRRVPLELFESARLDGANAWRCWAQLGLPLARPTLVAVGILTFVHYWSDFVDPLLYLKSESRYTLAIGLRILQQLDLTNWPLLMAGATIMTVPVLVGYFLTQRYAWMDGRLAGLVR
jgi:multiple sugar transport system permease protein